MRASPTVPSLPLADGAWPSRLIPALVALAAALSAACDAREAPPASDSPEAPPIGLRRAEVKIGAIHHRGPDRTDEALSVDRRDRRLRVEAAHLTISAIELHACEAERDGRDGFGAVLPLRRYAADLLVGRARAHVSGTALRLGTPYVEDLMGPPDRARLYGAVAPPPGTYCRVYAILAPADRDAVRAGDLSARAIRGHTLLVRGRTRDTPDAGWESFELHSDARRAVELRAVDPRTGEAPLVLDTPGDSTMLLIDKTLDRSTVDVDPAAPGAGDRILERLADALSIYTYD